MNVAVLFSGGKDSTMAVYNALENDDRVEYLLSMRSFNDESYMFHVPNIHLAEMLAEALEIPIIMADTKGFKEEELEDLKREFIKLKNLGIEGIYTGALYSNYQKSRIEKLGDQTGLQIISPYWHVNELEYMREIVKLGFEVIISGVFAEGFDSSWLGRKIDEETIDQLVELNERYYINIAFEGGEAETLVVDGPIFKKRLNIVEAQKEWNGDSGLYVVESVELVSK